MLKKKNLSHEKNNHLYQKPICRMKNVKFLISIAVAAMVIGSTSCQKEETQAFDTKVSTDVLSKIEGMGLSTYGVLKVEDGYLVENDIFISEGQLNESVDKQDYIIGSGEQYRTSYLVKNLPRTITISLSSQLPSNFGAALDEAIRRYNTLGLQITFKRVTGSANISITPGPSWWNQQGILGQGGFPTSNGNPYNSVMMNAVAFKSASKGYLATVLAHEIGHNIGFRHTDYMDRSYSCGGSYSNEGSSGVGAIQIPGTPANPEVRSWMLSCSDGTDRPFTYNDKVALNYIY